MKTKPLWVSTALVMFCAIAIAIPIYQAETQTQSNSVAQTVSAAQLNDFKPDGCTLFPEGPPNDPDLWAHCCFEHDLFYWAGGTPSQRLEADLDFKQCFKDLGQNWLAEVVYLAVRSGRFYPFRFRSQQWGNAWALQRNYRTHSPEDVELIIQRARTYQLPPELMSRFEEMLRGQQP